jgi:endonuclease YncB( thermonuclease family)
VIPGTEDIFDSPGKLLGMGAVGTLGNPIEKLTRYYNDGSWTMPLAARGAVRAMERVVAEKLAAGEMSPADAVEAQAEVSDRLPRNMAGRSIDLITAAGASFTRWQASEARERIQMDDYTARAGTVLDGDTLTVPDGKGGEKSVRFSDSNAPEIAHPEHGKAAPEFWGDESKAALAKLVPAGTPIKVLRDPEQLTEKYGRDLGNVEIPANFIQRAIWSVSPALDPFKGRDVGEVMIEQGATQPGQYRMLAENDPFRKFDYDQAAGRAQASGAGMFGPERETTDLTKVKPFKIPEYAKKEKTAFERISTAAGSSLMYTGRTGLLPGGAAVTWNAALAALGAAQHAEGGVRYSDPIEFKMPRAVKKSGTGSGSVVDTREAGEPPAALAGFGASLKALRR